MTAKINLFAAAPDMMKEWQRAMTQVSAAADFDSTITELMKLRASQINGCANCINLHVVEARRSRETYIGPWLPDPTIEKNEVEDVTLPLLLVLERLSPLERAAFVLHDVFGLEFEDVAAAIDRDEAACRQLAHRARTHIKAQRLRFKVERQVGLELAEAFFAASRSGDTKALSQMLAADVSLHADGSGKRPAASQPVLGFDAVRMLLSRLAPLIQSSLVRVGFVNGLPGFVTLEADGEFQTTALDIEGGRITAIYVVRNPDKLRHLHH